MLLSIHISNFMLFEKVDVLVEAPFVVVTGETGAGKSLFLQSLKFLSGGKKPSSAPLDPEQSTIVGCRLDLATLKHIPCDMLEPIRAHIGQAGNPDYLEIKRTLTPQGKSKMTIAGASATAAQVKTIMHAFFDINAQHQHLTILEEQTQQSLLDRYGDYRDILEATGRHYQSWQALLARQKTLQIALADLDDPSYLTAILEDIDQLNLGALNLDVLHQEQKQLQGRQAFLHTCQSLHGQLDGEDAQTVVSQLYHMQNGLDEYHTLYASTQDISQLLRDASTLAQEAANSLRGMLDCDYSADAERLQLVEQQLSAAHDCARKYRIRPEELTDFAEKTSQSMEKHRQYQTEISQLNTKISHAEADYLASAHELSTKRLLTAEKLTKHVLAALPSLNLPHALFHIKIHQQRKTPCATGTDFIEFLFSGNPGLALAKLSDCASGGELARLSLLLSASTPSEHRKTLIFDEADVGVSGKTASLIGKLMQQISKNHQIICLTHSPQVAACGHQHWHIAKEHESERTLTRLLALDHDAHIQEVARLLSGMDLSPESLASARQLCEQS